MNRCKFRVAIVLSLFVVVGFKEFASSLNADDALDSLRRIAEASRFPIASPNSYQYDPGIVGYSAGKEYTSGVHAAKVFSEALDGTRLERQLAERLSTILRDNQELNVSMHQFRKDSSVARVQGLGQALVTGVVGVVASQPNYTNVGSFERPVEIISPEEAERIERVVSDTLQTLNENARSQEAAAKLAAAAELNVAGARLVLYRELAEIWENDLYPQLIKGSVVQQADLVTIGSAMNAKETVVIKDFDARTSKGTERKEVRALPLTHGTFLVTPKQPLTNVTIRVEWKGINGLHARWFAHMERLSPSDAFVIPACGDFSGFISPLLLPAEVRENKLLGAAADSCNFHLFSDQGTQSFSRDFPSPHADAESIKLEGAENIAKLSAPGKSTLRQIQKNRDSNGFCDPLGTEKLLVEMLSGTRWKGELAEPAPRGMVSSRTHPIEFQFTDLDEANPEVKVKIMYSGDAVAVSFTSTGLLHHEYGRQCVLALPDLSRMRLNSNSSSLGATKKLAGNETSALPKFKAMFQNPPDSRWYPVVSRFHGAIISLDENEQLYLQMSTGDSLCPLERVKSAEAPKALSLVNKKPILSEKDLAHLSRLRMDRIKWQGATANASQNNSTTAKNRSEPKVARETEKSKKANDFEFGVLLLMAYCDACNKTLEIGKSVSAVSEKDIPQLALETTLIRFAPTLEPGEDPNQPRELIEDNPDFERMHECVDVFRDGIRKTGHHVPRLVKQTHEALSQLSDDGLLAIKIAYLKKLKLARKGY